MNNFLSQRYLVGYMIIISDILVKKMLFYKGGSPDVNNRDSLFI
jgi:hypothetical protein